jgi:hypothetical protein
MASPQIQVIPPLDGNLFTGPTRAMAGMARTLNPVLDTYYGEKMRWIYVGTAGNISYQKWDGTNQTLVGLIGGVLYPIYSLMINSSGTTASDIVVGS